MDSDIPLQIPDEPDGENRFLRFEFSGSPPNCSIHAFVGGSRIGGIDFDVENRPPLYVVTHSLDEDVRHQAERERDERDVRMIWLSTMRVVDRLQGHGVASGMLDSIVQTYPDHTITNSTGLSEAGEAFLRAWISATGFTNHRLLWRAEDNSPPRG